MSFDQQLFHWINGLAGHVSIIDRLFSGLADDYFMIVAMCLVLVGMWFGTRKPEERERNQVAVLKAMASLGIASGFVSWANLIFVGTDKYPGTLIHEIFNRPRPFVEYGTSVLHGLFYTPTDPSFPSNLAAVVFGLALAVWFMNRRVYVGIHYPSDILGGIGFAVIGVGLTYFLFWAFSPLMRFIKWLLRSLYLAG